MTYTFDPASVVPARDPTPEEWAKEVDEAQTAYVQLQKAVQGAWKSAWALAKACWRANECRAWLKLGDGTKGEWLAQPEIGMSRSTFDRYVRVWQGTVVSRKLDVKQLQAADVTKVDVVLPAVTRSRTSIEDALADAKVLGWHDLRDKYQGIPSPADPPTVDGTTGPGGSDGSDGDLDTDNGALGRGAAVPSLAESIEAMDDAELDAQEAYDSGAAYARLHHDTLGWILFDLRTRPARRPDLIEPELETHYDAGDGA